MSRMLIAASWMLIVLGLCSCAKEDGADPATNTKPKTAPNPTPQAVLAEVADFYKTVKSLEVSSRKQMQMEFSGQKRNSSGRFQLAAERPNRLFMENRDGQMGSTVVCDGKRLNVSVDAFKRYSEGPAASSFSELTRNRSFVMASGATVPLPLRMLTDNPVSELMEGVTSSTYVGRENVKGGRAHHLKFQLQQFMAGLEIEWELWVRADGDPVILQYRYTTANNKGMKMRNTITESFEDWKFNQPIAADKFVFTPPADAKKVDDLYASVRGGQMPKQPEPEPVPSSGNPIIDFFRSVDRGVKSTTRKPKVEEPLDADK